LEWLARDHPGAGNFEIMIGHWLTGLADAHENVERFLCCRIQDFRNDRLFAQESMRNVVEKPVEVFIRNDTRAAQMIEASLF
jgi:hypothetical protein